MSLEMIVVTSVAVLSLLSISAVVYRKAPRKLRTARYTDEWREIQSLCKDKDLWPQALQQADNLLDMALKRRKFKGKTMGERMVSAQRKFSNNDSLWFAHNLTKKITADPELRLREAQVKEALVGFRQSLRDLGAFEPPQQKEQTDESS